MVLYGRVSGGFGAGGGVLRTVNSQLTGIFVASQEEFLGASLGLARTASGMSGPNPTFVGLS
jgi:hypothetical protein